MENSQRPEKTRFSVAFMIIIIFFSAVSGGFFSYLLVSEQLNNLQSQVNVLQEHINDLQIIQNVTYVFGDTAFLSELYNEIKDSIVTILGVVVQNTPWGPSSSQVQGSGFVYNYDGQMVIITNFHVVNDAVDITVTFTDGNGYGATVLGSDPYADLAVLSTEAPQYEYKSLEIVSSSTLQVGNLIIALGSPYGLAGSMTTGIVSQLGRSIREETTGGFSIANVIQISAPINPGNSGGPLLNYQGQVVGITTAIVSDSQGLGFAIPSNTILREIKALVEEGHYEG
ncbi:trypsin-like peptidase domain-containing protein, partial [Candidatus Bathyarchaeota archaeon]|nr:trypsin-like peptidase domain-containing protein [Candidatus Bathyarchaeota archaeon]